jgi:hypothetical protein
MYTLLIKGNKNLNDVNKEQLEDEIKDKILRFDEEVRNIYKVEKVEIS